MEGLAKSVNMKKGKNAVEEIVGGNDDESNRCTHDALKDW